MRRHRFGRFAAFVAAGYLTAIIVAAVITLVIGDGDLLRGLVFHWEGPWPDQNPRWQVFPLVLAGGVQGWALWQILRGRVAGETGEAGRHIRRLRVVLYASLAANLISEFGPDLPQGAYVVVEIGQLALVVLFYRVLDGASRVLRLTALVVGTLDVLGSIGEGVSDEFGSQSVENVFELVQLDGLVWAFWMLLTLVAQARDGRWGRGTVWSGATCMTLPLLAIPMTFGLPYSGELLFTVAYLLFNVLLPVWLARSAHDLAGPRAKAVRRRERPVPVKAPFGRWPLPVTVVVLPLLPVAVNLAHGMPFWIGPRGAVESAVRAHLAHLTQLWLSFDLLVGVGGLGLLVLAAVTRRTRRSVWATVCVLLVAAVVGVVTAATTRETGSYTAAELSKGEMAFPYVGGRLYPDWMFHPAGEGGDFAFGVSPLWHSAAFVASALILISLYGWGLARRSPYRVVAACLAPVAVLCLLPVADQARGPVTSASDCALSEPGRGRTAGSEDPATSRPMTGERAFVCAVRTSGVLPSARDTSVPRWLSGEIRRSLDSDRSSACTVDDGPPREWLLQPELHGMQIADRMGGDLFPGPGLGAGAFAHLNPDDHLGGGFGYFRPCDSLAGCAVLVGISEDHICCQGQLIIGQCREIDLLPIGRAA
ncbi:hypothetical protein [Streptosporangium sp. NBC_01469]|uniref:hypothetical protein n=1 Tax=Streptosporangium sp. NBC_01469 TaxID=2903898 RepID=UPI002E2AEF9A|nr:hypothetical protein [Streptosporangium sp. NBC_01469]